jgi:hypothetical protein
LVFSDLIPVNSLEVLNAAISEKSVPEAGLRRAACAAV